MRQRESLAAVIVTLIFINQSFPSPVHPVDVAALTANAEIIVVGRVTDVTRIGKDVIQLPAGPVAADHFLGSLRIDRLLKGHSETPLSFEFSVPDMPIGFQGATEGEYAMFFLKSTGKNFAFYDLVHPSLPAAPDAPLPSGDTLDRVTATLGQVLSSGQASLSEQVRVLDALGRLQTSGAGKVLRAALRTSDADLRLRIATTLVARGDLAGLDLVASTLLHPGSASPELTQDAAGSLGGLKDANAIPTLAKLIATGNSDARRRAAVALRQSGSPSALEPLSRLLNDPDTATRYYAVIGLAEITHEDDWAPSFPEFQRDEGRYLAHWRSWAELNLH